MAPELWVDPLIQQFQRAIGFLNFKTDLQDLLYLKYCLTYFFQVFSIFYSFIFDGPLLQLVPVNVVMSQMIKSCPLSLLHLSAFSGIVSLISLVILSYDRYSTLTVYNKRGPNYRKPLLAVGGSWLYSLFWTVPPLLGWSSYGIEGAGTSCSVSWTVQTAQSHAYIICLFTFCLGIPILVMIYCYGRLLLAVKQVERHQSVCACVHVNVIFC